MVFCSWDRVVSLWPETTIDNKFTIINHGNKTVLGRQILMQQASAGWKVVAEEHLLYSQDPIHDEFKPGERSANDNLCSVIYLDRSSATMQEDRRWSLHTWRVDYCYHHSLKMLHTKTITHGDDREIKPIEHTQAVSRASTT